MAWEPVSSGEKVAYGLVNPGPLAPVLQGHTGQQNVEILREAVARPDPVPDPTKGPVPVGVDTPSKFGRVLSIAKEQRLVSPETKAALATPAAPTILGRLALNAGAQGASALAQGEDPAKGAAKGVLGQAGAEGVLKGAQFVGKALPTMGGGLDRFRQRAQDALTQYMKDKVPAWKDLPSLRDMFYGQKGHDSLHQFYDDSLKQVIEKGKGRMIQVPEAAAEALGIAGKSDEAVLRKILGARAGQGSGVPTNTPPGMVEIDAAEAAATVTGKWKKYPGAYRAIVNALDAADIGDPDARMAYKTAMGMKNLFDKTGALKGGANMDVMKAQGGLTNPKVNEGLVKRGMEGEVRGLLNPGGGPLIDKGSMAGPGAVAGSLFGAAGLGHVLPMWGHGSGAAGGALAGHYLGKKIPTYRNVPPVPPNPDLQMLLQHYLQGGIQQQVSS